MTNKISSSVMFVSAIVFLFLGTAQPDNLLFLFLSSNPLVGAFRILLAAAMMLLAFRNVLFNRQIRSAVLYTGIALISFGITAMLLTQLSSALYDYVKLIDLFVITEAGIVFTTVALTTTQTATMLRPAAAKLRQKAA